MSGAKPINVGLVCNNLDVGGLEKVVISLANHLDRRRFNPYVVTLSGAGAMVGDLDLPPENRLFLEKTPSVRIPVLGGKIDLSVPRAIHRFVKDKRIEIVHAHNLAPLLYSGIATRVVPMLRRPTLVYSEHNQIYSATPGQRRRFRYYIKLADHVVAVSRDLERTLVEKVGVRPDRVRVLYNGIDGARFAGRDPGKVRRELGIDDGVFVVGAAVVLSEQKGIRFLLEAAKEVLAKEPNVVFVIAGDGPLRGELERSSEAMGLTGRVRFLGYRRDVPDLVSAYDAYVLPSLWEGLPLALLEALAMGKPIVCTTVGGNPEIVEDGVNGYLVAPRDTAALADRILRLKRSPAFVADVRARNVEKFSTLFTLRKMVEAHARMFEELSLARRR